MNLEKAAAGEPLTYEEARELFALKDPGPLFEAARAAARNENGNSVTFYRNCFPPVSITGTACSLRCAHCATHYLNHMRPAPSEEEFVEHCVGLHEKGVPGIVLSGGCRPDGTVPLDDFAGGIRAVKDLTDLTILAHTGPINQRQARTLGRAGLDGALLDVIGSAETAERVYGVRMTPERFARTIEAIKESDIQNLSPHIIVGLDFGRVRGEIKALELLQGAEPDNICIIVLIPTRGTKMEHVPPPSPEVVGRITALAKLMHPGVPVALGCVRPGLGSYRQELDRMALMAGATKVAVPSRGAWEAAEELGLKVKEFRQMCCGWE